MTVVEPQSIRKQEITILVFGPPQSGKSSLIRRFRDNVFDPFAEQADKPKTHTMDYEGSKLTLIDATEKVDMKTIEKWIEFADGFMYVHEYFSDANIWSELLKRWFAKISTIKARQANMHMNSIPFLLVCSKYGDAVENRLAPTARVLERDSVKLVETYLSYQNKCLWDSTKYKLSDLYFQTSSETGLSVKEAFDKLIVQILDQRQEVNTLALAEQKKKTPKIVSLFASNSSVDDFDV